MTFLAIAILSGCATVIDGTKQEVTFHSVPSGAEVLINEQFVGKTPLTVSVKRANGTLVTVRKSGYKEQSIQMPTKLNSSFWGNFLIGGLPGSTTDAASGASREYAPGTHIFNLEKSE